MLAGFSARSWDVLEHDGAFGFGGNKYHQWGVGHVCVRVEQRRGGER